MYMMYVDESGDPGLRDSPTSYFVLSGIVVHERNWRTMIDQLVVFKKRMKTIHGLPVRQEIHASEFIRRKVADLRRDVRLAILRNVLDELAKMPFISITNVVVDKQGKPEDYNVFDAAWRTLFQRFENTLHHGNFPGSYKEDYGVVYTDAGANKQLTTIMRRMAAFNPIPNDTSNWPGYRNMPITKIIEDPVAKDSISSLPVQMADVAAYFLHQKFSANSYIKRKRAERYFERLEPVLNTRASRFDRFGVVKI
jgi:Protein of unknown function (DUF3800)